ncbi:MAG TPA: PEP/pyruvate-binding domain-containing protein, partial [Acidimicrobiia bacterium]|nr:PEP/pyruvate-binding domain-containing protein [Acidimicrobiia bacterium]
MITRLEDPSALNAEVVGAKAAALALARRGDLPVLPGFVIDASASRGHLALGSSQLAVRGSGGARLTVSAEPIPGAEQIEAAGRGLSSLLVARSSSPMEGDGKWAGAFTSYIGITPEELPKAVAGCWASTFSVDALDRQRRAGIEPGSVPMAVLVQPAIDAVAGGVAEITPEGTVRVEAVAGTPAALLRGWERGAAAIRRLGEKWEGAEAIALIGEETLQVLGATMDAASRR